MRKLNNVVAISVISSLLLVACSGGGEIPQATATHTSHPPAATDQVAEATLPAPTEIPTSEPVTGLADPLQIGAIADFSISEDFYGIAGSAEIVSDTQIVISGFVSFLAEAPGVDIRLGIDGDFSDEVALSLKNITGKDFDGRTVTLTFPVGTLESGRYDSIAVFCFDTGDLFDSAVFVLP